jgi:hypothetical protein
LVIKKIMNKMKSIYRIYSASITVLLLLVSFVSFAQIAPPPPPPQPPPPGAPIDGGVLLLLGSALGYGWKKLYGKEGKV